LALAAVCGIVALVAPTHATAADMALASRIPLPDWSLLEPQPEPDCKFKDALSNPITAEQMRMKLDYEQQCYRQAEEIVRTRLRQLQDSIGITIRVIEQRKHSVR
jgi:hypothetical protein